MSIFKRAMGAVGRAGGQMANRYIDEDLAMKRAQFMADLQHNNMVRADEYQNSPERRGKLREQAAQDTIAAGAATDTAAVNRLNNPQLNDATQAKAERDARTARALEIERLNDPKLQQATDADTRRKAERDAQIQRDQVKAAAADTGYLNSVSEVALADPKAREQIKLLRAQAVAAHASASNASANAAQTRAQTEAIIRVNDLTKEMERVLDDKTIDGPTRQKRLAELNAKAAVFGGGKKSEGGGVTEEIKDVIDPKTGEVISRERNRKGPLGALEQREGYPDGTELRGKDGKLYVVKDGKPVLKEEQPQKSPQRPVPREPQDRIGDGKIGPLTPQWMIEEAAKAGNTRAQEYLRRQESARLQDATAPTNAADMLR